MIGAMLELSPEIYGSVADPERVEIDGLLYILPRLPEGIEACHSIKLISREGFENSSFPVIVPSKRRRNCYRIDQDQMYIEMTRGRSDIYERPYSSHFSLHRSRKNSKECSGYQRAQKERLAHS